MKYSNTIRRVFKKYHNYVLYSFIMIPFFRPQGLEVTIVPSLYNIFFVWEMIAVFLFVIINIKGSNILKIRRKSEFRFIKLYIVYTFVVSVIMAFFKGYENIPVVGLFMTSTSVFIIIYISQKNYEMLVDFFYKYMYLINILNTLFIIIPGLRSLFTDDHYGFIGHRQEVSMVWALSVFLCLIKDNSDTRGSIITKKINTLFYLGITTFNLIYVMPLAATGIFAFFAFVISYIIMIVFNKFDGINNIAMYSVFIGGLLINYLIIAFNIQTNFGAGILSYLGETTSLAGRTTIYKVFFEAYRNSRLFGYGYSGIKVSTGWGGGWNALDYAHNTILQELTNGGMIGFTLFVIMGLYAIHNACKTNNLYMKKVVLCTLAAQMTIMIAESINYYKYYIAFLVLITYISRLSDPINKNPNQRVMIKNGQGRDI